MSLHPDPRVAHGQLLAGVARYPLLHAALTRHQSFRGGPMSFRGREYLVELYCIAQREGFDAVKAPQLGLTELLLQLAFQEAGWEGRIVGYALPTGDLRNGFVGRRVNKLLREVPTYRARLPGADLDDLRKGGTGSLRLKRLGSGLIQFLGAGSDGDFVEFSADTLILDEYDLCLGASELNVEKASDRLLEGRDPRFYRLGNAEISRAGISALFQEGDAREWCWKCPRCNEWQPIDWQKSIISEDHSTPTLLDAQALTDRTRDVRILCRRCRRFFAREEAPERCWIPHRPSIPRRSYRMCRWDATRYSIRSMWESYAIARASSTKARAWWRANGARVWEISSGKITRDDVMAGAILDPMNPGGRGVTAGIDVGTLNHVVVSDLQRGPSGRLERPAVWAGSVASEKALLDILERHRVQTAVIDAAPEPRFAARIRDGAREFGCQVFLCHFVRTVKASDELFGMTRKNEGNGITVDRTQVFDAAADAIHHGRMLGEAWRENPEAAAPDVGENYARLWPSDIDTALGFIPQITEPVRSIDEKGLPFWTKTEKADHYRLADVYDLIAAVLFSTGGSYG
jgi:hypothetical protein